MHMPWFLEQMESDCEFLNKIRNFLFRILAKFLSSKEWCNPRALCHQISDGLEVIFCSWTGSHPSTWTCHQKIVNVLRDQNLDNLLLGNCKLIFSKEVCIMYTLRLAWNSYVHSQRTHKTKPKKVPFRYLESKVKESANLIRQRARQDSNLRGQSPHDF